LESLENNTPVPPSLLLEIVEKWIEDDRVSHQGYVLEWNFGCTDADAIKHVISNSYKSNNVQFVEYLEDTIPNFVVHLNIDENESKERISIREKEDEELLKSIQQKLEDIKSRQEAHEQKEKAKQEKIQRHQPSDGTTEEGTGEDDQPEPTDEPAPDADVLEIEEDEEEKQARLQREEQQRQNDEREKIHLNLQM
jgi:hypothetical protein